jgi:poly(3-hydroxybutyrate) depolymerase
MLYQIYETQRSFMEPFVDFAHATAKMLSNSELPFTKNALTQRIAAGYDLMYRLGKDYEKPVFGITAVECNGVEIAIHERVEIDKPFCELRRFKRFTDDAKTLESLKGQPAVLIVAPLSGHYATLLRDTVRTMLKDHKVYITDWKNARTVPVSEGDFHLHDYVHYVEDFIRYLQGKYGNCHVMSVCQPTVPVLAAVSLMASRGETTPLSLTMMGGPIDARKAPTAVNNLATTKPFSWFENNVIYRVPASFAGKGRRVYPGFLQHSGFVAMNPDNHAKSHYDYFADLVKGDLSSADSHRKFYDEYNAVLDLDAHFYLETIKIVFQEFNLVKGTWDVPNLDGQLERVRPQDIKTSALLSVEGELDDITGGGQTYAAHALCSGVPESQHHHFEVEGAGHYGIFSGRRWREKVYPVVKAFILANHKTFTPATALVAPVAPVAPVLPAVDAAPAAPAIAVASAFAPVHKAPVVAKVPSAKAKTSTQKAAVAQATPAKEQSQAVKAEPKPTPSSAKPVVVAPKAAKPVTAPSKAVKATTAKTATTAKAGATPKPATITKASKPAQAAAVSRTAASTPASPAPVVKTAWRASKA